ncbi:MAG: SoxR reducing system RseC family protein [Desulfosalsimonas sp.]
MARAIGVVREVKERSAIVKTQRAPACEGCSHQGSCHMGGGKERLKTLSKTEVLAFLAISPI